MSLQWEKEIEKCKTPLQNRCIEIKSTWTYEKKVNDNIYSKLNALKNLGYKCELWVYNGKKEIEKCEII